MPEHMYSFCIRFRRVSSDLLTPQKNTDTTKNHTRNIHIQSREAKPILFRTVSQFPEQNQTDCCHDLVLGPMRIFVELS